MAGYAIDSDTAFGTTEGGALRKCPVDIYSERARRRGGRRERERISYDWVLTKTMPMRGAEPEMLRIHEYKKNKLKHMSKRRMGDSAEPVLGTTITLKRLKKRGYQSLTDVYLELNPSLCEPPCT